MAGTGELLERDRELAQLTALLDRAAAGHGGVALVEGPPGIGKSNLLAAARAAGAERGLTVLGARGSELEHDFTFGIVRQLLEPAVLGAAHERRVELLSGAAGLAAGIVGAAARDGGAPDPTFAVLHGLYWLCVNLAQEGPLLLAVDDAHCADGASLRFLAFLTARLDELPVALAVATRPHEPGADAALLAQLAGAPLAQVVRVRPLSEAGTAGLLAHVLGVPGDPAFAAAVHAATGGTPFLVAELAEALRFEGVVPSAAAAARIEELAPGPFARSVLVRLRRLAPGAAALAAAAAVLGDGAEPADAARLAGVDPGAAIAHADALAAAGVLAPGTPLQFVHPILRAAVEQDLPLAERSRLHREAARALAEAGAPRERVAAHLLAAEPAGDAWAVATLAEVAREAVRGGAPESAADLLRRALAEPPPPGERAGLLIRLGEAEAALGRAGAVDALEAALDVAAGRDQRAAAAILLAATHVRAGRGGESVAVLDRALATLGPEDEDIALSLEAGAVGMGRGDGRTAAAAAARADALSARIAGGAIVPRNVPAALAWAAVLGAGSADEAAALAERTPGMPNCLLWGGIEAPWFYHRAGALLFSERHAAARALLDERIAMARRSAAAYDLVASATLRAVLRLAVGDLAEAEADAGEALDLAVGRDGTVWYATIAAGVLVEALAARGEHDAARRALDAGAGRDGDRATAGATVSGAIGRASRGRALLALGERDDGLAELLEAGRQFEAMRVAGPLDAWRGQAAVALAGTGDVERAQELAAEGVRRARRFGAAGALGAALRAQALVSTGRAELDLLEEAIAVLATSGAALEHARALTDLGATLRRNGRRAEGREHLRVALDLAHRCGARPLARRAEVELRATGARPRRVLLTGLDALTPSERRVAEMAAGGMTNREIAQALFVTDRTVEGHLTSVFRKLGVAARSELRAVLSPPAAA